VEWPAWHIEQVMSRSRHGPRTTPLTPGVGVGGQAELKCAPYWDYTHPANQDARSRPPTGNENVTPVPLADGN
jgi:hypothetical protein